MYIVLYALKKQKQKSLGRASGACLSHTTAHSKTPPLSTPPTRRSAVPTAYTVTMAGRKNASQKFSSALGSARTHNARVSKKSKASARAAKYKNALLADDLDAILEREGVLGGKNGKKQQPGEGMEVGSAEEAKRQREKRKGGNVEDLLDRLGGL